MYRALNSRVHRQLFLLLNLCASLLVSLPAFGQFTDPVVHLSLCIDASGSISNADFGLQLTGTGDAIQDVVPIDGSVELSGVIFATNIEPLDFSPSGAPDGLAPFSLVINSQADKDFVESVIASAPRPAGGNLTNIQGCISQAMDQMGCGIAEIGGPLSSCPTDNTTRIIDISTDGDPTANNYDSDGNGGCSTTTGIPECNEDTYDAAGQASTAGVNVINVIGVGGGPSVNNMITWAFNDNQPYDNVTSDGDPADGSGNQPMVFDPGDIHNENDATEGLGNPPLPVSLLPGYVNTLPVIGDSGYVVVVADFTEYQPTINAKIFNELNIEADISVLKTAPGITTVSSGQTFTYNLAVTNNDSVDVPAMISTDTLPPGVTYEDALTDTANAGIGGDVCDAVGQVVTCDIGTLAGNDTVNIAVVVTVN